jgi:hypothetical protein
VQGVDLLAAAVFAPLAQQLRDARERRGEQQLEPLGADALAPAGHRGAVERQGVLDVGLAAEERDRGAVEEAGADGRIGEAVHVLMRCSPTMRRVG